MGAATAPSTRLTERHVLALGLAISAGFVLAAAAAAGWIAVAGGGTWAVIHLALAGAATVAIGTFMPHFAVTLAGTRPAPSGRRLASIAALAVAAAGVVVGVSLRLPTVVAVATLLALVGLAGTAAHTVAPTRDPLARRHPIVLAAYGLALGELAAGVVLGGLAGIGSDAVLGAWALLRPVHAWLTLFGAISLTIAATLVYLAPTVLGARIRAGWSLGLMVGGIGLGPIVAAAGFALDARVVVATGMGVAALGAVGQIGYVLDCHRRRGTFTSEHDWRRVAIGHLAAGTAWFAAATVAALVDLLAGRALAGWSIGLLALPLVAGWMLQELVGSWTHLVPSVAPGDPDDHARQRRILAIGSRTRLIGWNLAALVTWTAAWLGIPAVLAGGAIGLLATVVTSTALMGRALTIGRY